MAHLLELVAAVLTLYLFFSALQALFAHCRYSNAARQHGCKPARRYPNTEPLLGLDLFIRIRAARRNGHRSDAFLALHREYGATFELKALSRTEILTAHPENIKAVATTHFEDFGVGPRRGNVGAPFLDRGVFTEDGDFWKRSRALIRPTFSRNEVANLTSFEKHVNRFMALVPHDSSTVDLQPLAKRLFLDTSTEFLFGQSVESLLPETPFDTATFLKAFDASVQGFVIRGMAGRFRPLLVIDHSWKKAYRVVHSFVDKQIDLAIKRHETDCKEPIEGSRSGKQYVLLQEMTKETHDRKDLQSQIINVFFPARDAAAIAFGNTMFYLARHPSEWEDLRAEVLGIGNQELTYELLKSLKTTRSIINETLRLHVPVSRVTRVALRDTVLPVGGGLDGASKLFIRKGQTIKLDLYSVQRDPEIWGGDVEEFRPQRWRHERPLWGANWQYAPFLGGMRMCPAQNQVITQLSYLLVRMAQRFRAVECRDSVWEYEEETMTTIQSRNGVKVGLIPV